MEKVRLDQSTHRWIGNASSASVSYVGSPDVGRLYYWLPARFPIRGRAEESHVICEDIQGRQSMHAVHSFDVQTQAIPRRMD
jgi:hypothetical protein